MYSANVDFGVGDLDTWIDQQVILRGLQSKPSAEQPFLSHAILDLPGSDKYVKKVASILHPNGTLVVFNPSITQIVDCVEVVRRMKVPLILDRVIELGAGMTGGRTWDVRSVKPRASSGSSIGRGGEAAKEIGKSEDFSHSDGLVTDGATEETRQSASEIPSERKQHICYHLSAKGWCQDDWRWLSWGLEEDA